jgi:hypothetical protein
MMVITILVIGIMVFLKNGTFWGIFENGILEGGIMKGKFLSGVSLIEI